MKDPIRMPNVVRVHIHKNKMTVMPFDPLRWELQPPIDTDDMSDIPEWIQRKIAVLMMVSPSEFVEGVGRRISSDTFWIYFEEDHDTGSEGKKEST